MHQMTALPKLNLEQWDGATYYIKDLFSNTNTLQQADCIIYFYISCLFVCVGLCVFLPTSSEPIIFHMQLYSFGKEFIKIVLHDKCY